VIILDFQENTDPHWGWPPSQFAVAMHPDAETVNPRMGVEKE